MEEVGQPWPLLRDGKGSGSCRKKCPPLGIKTHQFVIYKFTIIDCSLLFVNTIVEKNAIFKFEFTAAS